MLSGLPFFFLSILLTGCSNKYFIVRHAEKAQVSEGLVMNTPNNPPLSPAGEKRAIALKERVSTEKINYIFSTNTSRTIGTVMPAAEYFGITIQTYPKVDSIFIDQLKRLRKNVLIVGHSNTIDALVNGLTGENQLSDLPETAYDDLFIVWKKGKKLVLQKEKYGQPSPR